jgi:hypothetical protein
MTTGTHLSKNRQFWKILHKLLKNYLFHLQSHYIMATEKEKSGLHISTSEYTVKLKFIHILHIKIYTSCIYAESGEQ